MNKHALALVAIAMLGAVTACGGTARTTSPPGVNQQATQVLRELARCIRAHGLPNFPDPVVGNNGVPKFPPSAPSVPASARRPCAGIANRIPPQYSETQPVSQSDFRKLLQFARCVRTHGIPDWPDPNALGEFPINRRIERGGKPLFFPAAHACARLTPNPSGGINVVRAP